MAFRYFVEKAIIKIYTLDWRQLKNKNIFAILISSMSGGGTDFLIFQKASN